MDLLDCFYSDMDLEVYGSSWCCHWKCRLVEKSVLQVLFSDLIEECYLKINLGPL